MRYVQVVFRDTDDIYIVRVHRIDWADSAKEARRIMNEQLHEPGDFEIRKCTLASLLNESHFVGDIAQLHPVTCP